jgi:hypothetical protein
MRKYYGELVEKGTRTSSSSSSSPQPQTLGPAQ